MLSFPIKRNQREDVNKIHGEIWEGGNSWDALVACGYCNKLPETWWLKTTCTYPPAILAAGKSTSVVPGCNHRAILCPGALREAHGHLPKLWSVQSLAHCPFHLSNKKHIPPQLFPGITCLFSLDFPSVFPLYKLCNCDYVNWASWIIWDDLNIKSLP